MEADNSPMEVVQVRISAAAIAGSIAGKTTRGKVRTGGEPRLMAVSSMEFGIFCKVINATRVSPSDRSRNGSQVNRNARRVAQRIVDRIKAR